MSGVTSGRALTVTGAWREGAQVGVRSVDGVIVALGPDVVAEPDDEVLDAEGLALLPGLVNGHTHAAMTLLRGYGDDLALRDWLEQRIWPAEARLRAEDVYWGTRLACLEMARSGTVRFWDMYWHSPEVARAAVDAGLRVAVSQVVLDVESAPPEARIAAAPEGLDRLAAAGPLVTPSLGPHAIYTVSETTLRTVSKLSQTRDVPVQIHLAETQDEVIECIGAHDCRPAEYLDRVGLLDERTVIAHGVWLDDDELRLVAKRGATIVTNPVSNMKLAVGRAFPYPAAREAGIPIGLGTDGAASNNGLDLLADVKVFALLQKHVAADPSVAPAEEAFALATGEWAPRLGGTPVALGEPADFVLARRGAVELEPGPLVQGLVYATSSAVIDTVVVAGRVVMRHREIEGEEEVVARAREAAARVRGEG